MASMPKKPIGTIPSFRLNWAFWIAAASVGIGKSPANEPHEKDTKLEP